MSTLSDPDFSGETFKAVATPQEVRDETKIIRTLFRSLPVLADSEPLAKALSKAASHKHFEPEAKAVVEVAKRLDNHLSGKGMQLAPEAVDTLKKEVTNVRKELHERHKLLSSHAKLLHSALYK
eukprot:1901479-Prymnesium_polylepis.1